MYTWGPTWSISQTVVVSELPVAVYFASLAAFIPDSVCLKDEICIAYIYIRTCVMHVHACLF